jgi:hypothetical protein
MIVFVVVVMLYIFDAFSSGDVRLCEEGKCRVVIEYYYLYWYYCLPVVVGYNTVSYMYLWYSL